MASTINASTTLGLISSADTSGVLQLQTANTTAVTIDASQNVGVGTTTMTRNFNIGGSNAGVGLNLNNTGTSGRSFTINSTNSSASVVGVLGFYDDTASAYRMVIDSSGNLGVGTTSPSVRLDIQVSTGTATVKVGNGTLSGGALLNLQGASGSKTWFVGSNYNVGGGLEFTQSTANGGSTIGSTPSMVIDSSGNLLVGTTSANTATKIDAVSTTSGVACIGASVTTDITQCFVAWNKATAGNNIFHQFYTEASATSRGSITYNRAGGLVAYNVTSDYRAKDISGPVTNSGALIDSVPVYMGKMKGATQERPMFIAHETPAYAHIGEKDAVDANGNPVYQQMDASSLIPVMWAEIQSLRQRLAVLEGK